MPSARLIENTGSLAGASVIVTRPAATAADLRRRVRALGGNPLGLPGMLLRANADVAAKKTLAAARAADIAIFVSPAAVKFAFLLNPKLRFARCAVGAATARAGT